jgi:uncharacterized protein (DUF2147 family)
MRVHYLHVGVCLALLTGSSLAASPIDPSGIWLTEDGRARVRIERCMAHQEQVCGYAVWLKNPTDANNRLLVDVKNPDQKKRGRPLLGHQMILGMKPDSEGRYAGRIYNSDNGKTYDVTLWRENPTMLKLRGCIMAVLCGSQTWTRVNDVASGQLVGPTQSITGPRTDPETQ